MKKHLLLLCLLLGLVGTRASASDFRVTNEGNTICYNIISDSEVEVTYSWYSEEENIYYHYYKGEMIIPSTVEYNGKTYTVTKIGDNAFDDNYITSFSLPYTITTIGTRAFCNSRSVTSITIPYGVTTIEDQAFHGCRKATNIEIPTSVTSIGYGAFGYCEELTSITIPEGVETLKRFTFQYCTKLKTVIFPKSLTAMDTSIFSSCNNISSITVKSTTSPTPTGTTLGGALSGVPKSCVLTYPKGCYESYASWAEYITVPLTDFSVDGFYYNVLSEEDMTVEVTFQGEKYNSYADEYTGDIVIPQTVTYADKTFTVTAIGESAFCGCENITSIQLPSTIKEIKEYGVNYCTKLTSINLPEGLTTIGPRAFRICTSLTSLEIPSSVTSIGEDAFYDDGNLVSITFKGAINSIGNGAFRSCEKLTEIHVEDIADWCQMGFADASSHPLTANLLYDNYGSITGSKGALYINDEKITNLVIPDNVEKINDYAFYVCEDFTSVDLGKGVKSIGNYAFAYCTGLESLTIPANVTSIGNNALDGDHTNLSELTIEDATTPLTLGHCPNGESQGWGLFCTCRLTEPIYIGRDLVYNSTHFGGYSPFNLCNGNTVPSVTFGKYVTEVGNNLFGEVSAIWSSLKNIYFNSNPALEYGALYAGATIHLNLSDEEATDFCADNANTYADVTYERNLPAGKYGTITLPFTPDAESTGNFVFYQLSSANEKELMFDEVAQPQANTPYLYTLREGKSATQITGGQTTIASTINNPETVNNMQMIGSFTNQTIATGEDASNYYYAYTSADNKLHKILQELTVKPYRAYFKNPAMTTFEVSSYSVYLRGANGIQKISIDDIEDFDHMLYDMSGRPVSNPVKGNIYIKNGKKLIY